MYIYLKNGEYIWQRGPQLSKTNCRLSVFLWMLLSCSVNFEGNPFANWLMHILKQSWWLVYSCPDCYLCYSFNCFLFGYKSHAKRVCSLNAPLWREFNAVQFQGASVIQCYNFIYVYVTYQEGDNVTSSSYRAKQEGLVITYMKALCSFYSTIKPQKCA